MKYLIVDDRRLAASALAEVVGAVDPAASIDIALGSLEALRFLEDQPYDVTFLDIEMPGENGIDLARHISELDPTANIVFVTGHPGYALEAHDVFPSGFLVKPVVEADIERVLANLRHPVHKKSGKLITLRCLGNFEVFADGRPLDFERAKTKELLAYLTDREGAKVGVGEAAAVLWEDASGGSSKGSQLRNLIHDLRRTLREAGADDVLIRSRGEVALDRTRVDCDYFRLLDGDPAALASYRGEYMSQYSWAEYTAAHLERMLQPQKH